MGMPVSRSVGVLIASVLACNAAGWIGAAFTDVQFYRELAKPDFSPPSWVFGPVWTALYTLMGVAAWLVWRRPATRERSLSLVAFAVQLGLNAAWTPVFFGLKSLGGGLVVIGALWVAVAVTAVLFFRASRPAGYCLLPYLAWITFAGALNAALWRMNG